MEHLAVFEPDLSNYHDIESVVSFKATVFFNGIGKFSLVVPLTDFNGQFIRVECIIVDKKTWTAFVIANAKIDTEKRQIFANGYTANWILNKRIDTGFSDTGKKILIKEKDIYDRIKKNLTSINRDIPILSFPSPKGYTETAETGFIPKKHLLDETIEWLNLIGLGHCVKYRYEFNKLEYEIYKGRDLTSGAKSQVFSEETGTAKSLVINNDITAFKTTYTIIGYINYPKGRIRVTTVLGSDAAGNSRYEEVINEEPQLDITDNNPNIHIPYFQSYYLEPVCRSALAKHLKRESFDIEIDSSDFGTVYNLGDMVRCVSNKYNVNFTAKVNAVTYTLDARGEKVNLLLGEPNLNIVDMIKQG